MTGVLYGSSRELPFRSRDGAAAERPDLLDWLRTGRLTLVGADHEPVHAEDWGLLPADVRSRALADFDRIVRSNAKAAVLFLR
jgi:hypothetical protein